MTIASYFRTSGAEIILPTLVNGPTLNVGVGAWPAGWTTLVAVTANDYILCGAHVTYRITSGGLAAPGQQGQIRIGVGAAAAEVPIAQASFAAGNIIVPQGTPDTIFLQQTVFAPFKPVLVPAGSRLSGHGCQVRIMDAFALYMTGYESWDHVTPYYSELDAITYAKGVVGVRSMVYPDAGSTAVFTGNPAWTFGAYVPFIAVTAVPTIIRGIIATPYAMPITGTHVQYDIGVGGAGSEVVVGRTGLCVPTFGAPGGEGLLPRPYIVKEGERVAIRNAGGIPNDSWSTMLLVEEMI